MSSISYEFFTEKRFFKCSSSPDQALFPPEIEYEIMRNHLEKESDLFNISRVCKQWKANVVELWVPFARNRWLDDPAISVEDACYWHIDACNTLFFATVPGLKECVQEEFRLINETRQKDPLVPFVSSAYFTTYGFIYSQRFEKIKPHLKISDLSVFEIKALADKCCVKLEGANDQLQVALREAIAANDHEKITRLFEIGAKSSAEVLSFALVGFAPDDYAPDHIRHFSISPNVLTRLFRDVQPSIDILDHVFTSCSSKWDVYRQILIDWDTSNLPKDGFTQFLSKHEVTLGLLVERTLGEGDLHFASNLAKKGIKCRRKHHIFNELVVKVKKKEAPVWPNFVELFEACFACGSVPNVGSLELILKSKDLSDDQIVGLIRMFAKYVDFKSKDFDTDGFLINFFSSPAAVVKEVIPLLFEQGLPLVHRFLSLGIAHNALSVEMIQACLNAGFKLSKDDLLVLSHNENLFEDDQAIAKLQLFVDAGVSFKSLKLFPYLNAKVPLELFAFVCDKIRMIPQTLELAADNGLSIEHLKVLIAAGCPVTRTCILWAKSEETKSFLQSVMDKDKK